ncbi:MAG: hypothetical protein U9N34_08790 [Candidatus Cloacimonadota bacterium]|nr:hypothetical protein [Candidatus Cloacimonadota bacterium]
MILERLKRIVNLFIFISLISLIYSCDIFEPRDAHNPINTEFEWNDFPTSPYQTLENLEWAFEYIQNADNYQQIFTDDFIFYFDSQDISEHSYESSWGIGQEQNIVQNYYSQTSDNSPIDIELVENEENDQINSNNAHIYRDYVLNTNYDILDFPDEFVGKLEIFLVFQNGNWKINYWKDFRTSSSDNMNTWGRFKHEFSS